MGGGTVGVFDDLAGFGHGAGEVAVAVHGAGWWGGGDGEVEGWGADGIGGWELVLGLWEDVGWKGDVVVE